MCSVGYKTLCSKIQKVGHANGRAASQARNCPFIFQIQEKFKLLEPGLTVMECGCAPGSWSQVAAKLINSGGLYDQGNLLRGIDNKTVRR